MQQYAFADRHRVYFDIYFHGACESVTVFISVSVIFYKTSSCKSLELCLEHNTILLITFGRRFLVRFCFITVVALNYSIAVIRYFFESLIYAKNQRI